MIFSYINTHVETCTNVQPSCKPFNAATQWCSVRDAALDSAHWDREHFVVASEPDSCHVRIVCHIECLLPSLSVGCVPLFHFWEKFERALCQFLDLSTCFMCFMMCVIPDYRSHDFVCHPSCWLAIHHWSCQLHFDAGIIHRSPV